MTWKELHTGRGGTGSSSGDGRTRSWRVTLTTVDVAMAAPEAPKFGDEHPDYPGLVVNNTSFFPQGPHVLVGANYVPIEFQDWIPPENQTAENWTKIDSSFEDVDVDIPIFQLVTKQFPVVGGGVESKLVWTVSERTATFRYSKVVHRVTLNAIIQGGSGVITQLNVSDFVNQQTNKIHLISGRRYLFKSDNVKRIKEDLYQFTYRWIYDPGVVNTINDILYPSGNSRIKLVTSATSIFAYPVFDEDFIIPGYTRLDYGPSGSDPSALPNVEFKLQYEEEDNGHLLLPGVA